MTTNASEMDEKFYILLYDIHTKDPDPDGAAIVFDCNGKHIAVSLYPSHSTQDCNESQHTLPMEDYLIGLLVQTQTLAAAEGDAERILALENKVLDSIVKVGKSVLSEVAPFQPVLDISDKVLHSILFPDTLYFRLQTIDGKPSLFPSDASEAYMSPPKASLELDNDFNLQLYGDLPKYSTKEISVLQNYRTGFGRGASQVLVNGQEMFCKSNNAGLYDSPLKRELVCLQEVHCKASSRFPIRVPKLLGYVKHAENSNIVGLLREWIVGDILSDINIPTTSIEKRWRWAAQIDITVDQLHRIGVIWGDGKTDNIIIDEKDNAWLIDFGGGWTKGWVAEELAETADGDDQAVKNIRKFLDV